MTKPPPQTLPIQSFAKICQSGQPIGWPREYLRATGIPPRHRGKQEYLRNRRSDNSRLPITLDINS